MKSVGLILIVLGLATVGGSYFMSRTASQTTLTLMYVGFGVGIVLILVGFVLWQKGGTKSPVAPTAPTEP